MPYTETPGFRMRYSTHGSEDPLLLINGLGSDSSEWLFQFSDFTRHFRVIVFDNRGAGGSETPRGPYSTKQMADDAAALALITQELNLFRGRSVLVLVPANHNNLARQLYAIGARNCEIHLAQCRGQWVAPSGVNIPTFLPETA